MIRFPKYYAMGFAIVLTSMVCSVVRFLSGARTKTDNAVLILLTIASATMLIDYVFIYTPLHGIMVDLERPRDADFQWYHQASKYINSVGILLALIAAILVCRQTNAPLPPSAVTPPDA